jgi:ABC-type cobalamin/Fe3+-siderophores transport system ATPase subunit
MIRMLTSQGGNVTMGSQLVSALSQQAAKQQQCLVNSMDHQRNSSSASSSVSRVPSPFPKAGTTPSSAQLQQATHQGSILPTLNGPITSKVII